MSETNLVDAVASSEASAPGDAPLDSSQSVIDSGSQPLFSDAPPESASSQEESDGVSEFSSQDSSVNISQFSEQSQSILRDVNGSVNVNLVENTEVSPPIVVVVDEGTVPLSQDIVENMDSSVCLKRKECAAEPEFATPVHLSRRRSHSEDSRKKRRGASASPSPSRGQHAGLPKLPSTRSRRT